MTRVRQFAVVGNPVGHSLSPRLHTLFARQTGIALNYEKHCVEPGHFQDHVARFFAAGGDGLNITIPFKLDAYALADPQVSPRARAAGAANTLWQEAGRIHACNTDGVGLVNDILRQQVPLKDSRILLLGAGGAARGVILPLLQAGCGQLHIANRTATRAQELAGLAASLPGGADISSSGLDDIPGSWDIIVNASASSLQGGALPVAQGIFHSHSFAYDMLYTRDGRTPFLQQAQDAGAAGVSDGLGMLVYQGAESFQLWNGQEPDAIAALAALRAFLTEQD